MFSLSDTIPKTKHLYKVPDNVGCWRNKKGGGRYYISLTGKKLIGKEASLQFVQDKKSLEQYRIDKELPV